MFRLIYHQKEQRSDTHLFITVFAYHLLNTAKAIENKRILYQQQKCSCLLFYRIAAKFGTLLGQDKYWPLRTVTY